MNPEPSSPTAPSAGARSVSLMHLSLAVSVALLFIKVGAWAITGSAAVLGDAAESIVHVFAVLFASWSLRFSRKPADQDHLYGHAKITFFSAGVEGMVIAAAALFIGYESGRRWFEGRVPDDLGWGLALVALALVINGLLGWLLVREGRRSGEVIVEANGFHVLTDCYTSLGVLVALGLVHVTGWPGWDPLVGLLLAGVILHSARSLLSRGFRGLMDKADPRWAHRIDHILRREVQARGLSYHEVRHRDLGNAHWIDLHLLFPGRTPVDEAHAAATAIEAALIRDLPGKVFVTSHIEPLEAHDRHHARQGVEDLGRGTTSEFRAN